MLTSDTIEAAIAADDTPTLRSMFDALVRFPDQPLDGFADPTAIFAALDRVVGALVNDVAFLPEDTFALLWLLGVEAGAPLIGMTYASGANVILRGSRFFAERFAGEHRLASA